MFEGSRILSDYLKTKFKDTPTIEVFNYAISNEDKLSYFSEETIEYFLNKDNLEGLNLGLSQISPNGGTPTQMRDIYGLLNERFDFFSDFNFIKVDTETVDYFILSSLKNFIKKLKVKPFICFEHNYHNTMDVEVAKQIYHEFLSECGYIGEDFELLTGDISLTPIETTIVETTIVNKEIINLTSTNTTDDNKPRIRIHNPSNSYTKDYRNYNRFWDDLTDYLKTFFNVDENRFFENAHSQRFPIKLTKGKSNDFCLLECEYIIENLDNGEFVIMSVSDDLTHAILNEKENPYLKKVLVSQFLTEKISENAGKFMFKYSPWTYFQSSVIDLDRFYYKRLLIKPTENKIYFKGTSLEDREFLKHIDSDLITNFTPIVPEQYFNDIIKHKLALSIDGRGEFCYRDIECFGIGVPILRFEYNSRFYNELIPNYHYISIPRPSDMKLFRSGNEEHYKLFEQRYMEVINDEEFLSFISKNARKYYEDNIIQHNKLKKTFDLLNLNNWL
jgi:hypothetical protein